MTTTRMMKRRLLVCVSQALTISRGFAPTHAGQAMALVTASPHSGNISQQFQSPSTSQSVATERGTTHIVQTGSWFALLIRVTELDDTEFITLMGDAIVGSRACGRIFDPLLRCLRRRYRVGIHLTSTISLQQFGGREALCLQRRYAMLSPPP